MMPTRPCGLPSPEDVTPSSLATMTGHGSLASITLRHDLPITRQMLGSQFPPLLRLRTGPGQRIDLDQCPTARICSIVGPQLAAILLLKIAFGFADHSDPDAGPGFSARYSRRIRKDGLRQMGSLYTGHSAISLPDGISSERIDHLFDERCPQTLVSSSTSRSCGSNTKRSAPSLRVRRSSTRSRPTRPQKS